MVHTTLVMIALRSMDPRIYGALACCLPVSALIQGLGWTPVMRQTLVRVGLGPGASGKSARFSATTFMGQGMPLERRGMVLPSRLGGILNDRCSPPRGLARHPGEQRRQGVPSRYRLSDPSPHVPPAPRPGANAPQTCRGR